MALALFAAMTLAAAPLGEGKTYLASLDVPMKRGERVESFSIETWGVVFRAVCHIPYGWRIRAGNKASPDGVLEGSASQGVTRLDEDRARQELGDLVLLRLVDKVQRRDIKIAHGVLPATFKGKAAVGAGDDDRTVRLTAANLRLRSASRCPQ